MEFKNRQFLLVERPIGRGLQQSDFRLQETKISESQLQDGEVLLKTEFLSVDPTQKLWATGESYAPAQPLNKVMRAYGIAQVLKSKHPNFNEGDQVEAELGWQEFAILSGDTLIPIRKANEKDAIALPMFLTMFNNVTAYFGLTEVGHIKKGDTVLVSGAAGATGFAASQIAKIFGCYVVGTAGSEEKCRMLIKEAGVDATINYKTTQDMTAEIKHYFPEGVDIFYDNVGGKILDSALENMKVHGKIAICGVISQYNKGQGESDAVHNTIQFLFKRIKMEGFLIYDYRPKWGEVRQQMVKWIQEGKLKPKIDVMEGFENCPRALARLFTSQNLGKQIVKVCDPTK